MPRGFLRPPGGVLRVQWRSPSLGARTVLYPGDDNGVTSFRSDYVCTLSAGMDSFSSTDLVQYARIKIGNQYILLYLVIVSEWMTRIAIAWAKSLYHPELICTIGLSNESAEIVIFHTKLALPFNHDFGMTSKYRNEASFARLPYLVLAKRQKAVTVCISKSYKDNGLSWILWVPATQNKDRLGTACLSDSRSGSPL